MENDIKSKRIRRIRNNNNNNIIKLNKNKSKRIGRIKIRVK
jgi:hypothetical protein